jgi:hypothetical protein
MLTNFRENCELNDELAGCDLVDSHFVSFQRVYNPIVVEFLKVSDQIRT